MKHKNVVPGLSRQDSRVIRSLSGAFKVAESFVDGDSIEAV